MGQDFEQLLIKGADTVGVSLTQSEAELYLKYLDMLVHWNEKMNLTAIKDPVEIVVKHFIDSISLLPYLKQNSKFKLLDVGTGAGFPGVPIKIANPDIDVVLLDSLSKRLTFLQNLIEELKLKSISVVHGRAEDLGHTQEFREMFDIVTSRAVAKLAVLAELCLPFVKVGGLFVAYKGPKILEEIKEAGNAIEILGGRLHEQIEITLPDREDKRTLLLIRKIKTTPKSFPRKAGTPEKKPLS